MQKIDPDFLVTLGIISIIVGLCLIMSNWTPRCHKDDTEAYITVKMHGSIKTKEETEDE